jgi:hypothetical protein
MGSLEGMEVEGGHNDTVALLNTEAFGSTMVGGESKEVPMILGVSPDRKNPKWFNN